MQKHFQETDWEKLRQEVPATRGQVYLMSAAVGPLSTRVYQASQKHLEQLYQQGDIHWQDNLQLLDDCRIQLASLLNAEPSDIGFTPNTSHNLNLLAMMFKQEKKRKIISLADEFPSTTLPWYHHGYEVKRLATEHGFIAPESIYREVDSDTAAVVISAIQFSTGFRLNINKLGKWLKEKDVPFIVNATQAIGAFPVSVKEAHITALSASCHKWLMAGFSGSVLYLNESIRKSFKPPLAGWFSVKDFFEMRNEGPLDLRDDTGMVETGILPFTALAGLKEAAIVAMEIGINNIARRIFELSDYLINKLSQTSFKVISPRDQKDLKTSVNTGIICITVEEPQVWEQKLADRKVFVSARRNCLRIAIHYFNNLDDLDYLLEVLDEIKNEQ